jgi:hypothetical protein
MPSTDARGTARRTQRADARRNIAAILDAATDCLARDPETSIAGIAAAAGVGRITLYGHFKTRADLVDAVLARTIEHADAILGATDTGGDQPARSPGWSPPPGRSSTGSATSCWPRSGNCPPSASAACTTRSCAGYGPSSRGASAPGPSAPTCRPNG